MSMIKPTFKVLATATLVMVIANCATQPESSGDAQEKAQSAPVETVVITGSRMKRTDNDSSRFQAREDSDRLAEQKREHQNIESEATKKLINELPPEFYRRQDHYQIFKAYGVNPTVTTAAEPISTFAMDVDTGSFKLAMNMLSQGYLPAKEGIRVEEFINAMNYQYRASDDTFAISAEVMPSPYRRGYHLLHLGIQAQQIAPESLRSNNLVLVADVSGSMASDNKLELLKQAMITLVSQLNEDDQIALVTYSDEAKVVIPPTSAKHARYIESSILNLRTEGSTHAEAGIMLGYQLANELFDQNKNNRVILTSDGMANVGQTSPQAVLKQIDDFKHRGIFLTTVGVGLGMYNDHLLEQLADRGNGAYLYLSNQKDIQEAFIDKLNQQLYTVAKDAKIQMQFNPKKVSSYRLLGYENRHLNNKDFLDASKDGGEVGSGQRVTALYEIKLTEQAEPIGRVSVAYKNADQQKVNQLTKAIPESVIKHDHQAASSDLKMSAAVAAFAEKLRQSYWSRMYTYQTIHDSLASLPANYLRTESLRDLMQSLQQAALLDNRHDPYEQDSPISSIDLDRVPLLQ